MRQTQSASKPIPALLRALSRREQGPSVAASATQATCGRRAAAVGSGGSSDAETTPALAASWNTGTCSPLRAQISPGGPAGGRGGRPGAGYRAPHPALPTAAAQEAGKVSGPCSAEALSRSTLRKHLPPLLGISRGLHPLTLGAAWAAFCRLGPGSRGPFPWRCLRSFNKVMFGSCLAAVAAVEGGSRYRGGSRGGSPGSRNRCPGPPGTAMEAELHQHPLHSAPRWFRPRGSRLSANGSWRSGVTGVRAGL
ncbi:cyclin-dependent kinases regulatory subunit 1 isoform X1 [Passer montanus]|uniref:cyclin-dependent kinases regulatory subunit 1 isoform X1 n=1 Tax=Passer montanus TaxID=9160 RepID=UPI00195F3BE4|nr:cyclin-dependent kinases regulatory subunit 1 isoform X1 [Passer montanus]